MRIGILTSGGDCPGINATIRGVCKTAINYYGMEVVGIHSGFQGLLTKDVESITDKSLSGLLNLGGTMLGTSREKPFKKGGVVSDVERIAGIVHEKGIPLIMDEAHGAHFGFHPYFPKNSNTLGADIVIHSLHKTLPSLTQTALLHMNGELANRTDIREYVHMLQSSSPSYILMAGIDECVRFVGERSSDVFDNYVKRLESVRKRISRLSVLKLIETEKYDRSKIVTAVGNHDDEDINRFTGKQLYDVLKDKYLLQPEMASGSYVVLMTSPADTDEGMERLVSALEEIDGELAKRDKYERNNSLARYIVQDSDTYQYILKDKKERDHQKNIYIYSPSETKRQRLKKGCESVEWKMCGGKVAAEYAYIYPPGIPLIVPGEQISGHFVKNVRRYLEQGFEVQGLSDQTSETVCVVRNEM